MISSSLRLSIKKLWLSFSRRHRWYFKLLILQMILTSFAEVISIGAIIPFLGALTDANRIFEEETIQPLIYILDLQEPKQLLLPLAAAFGLAALFAGFMRLLLLWTCTRISFVVGSDLSIDIYRRTLYQPYLVHCSRNSSDLINAVTNKSGVVINSITTILTLISSGIMLFTILASLVFINPSVAFAVFGCFGFIYWVVIYLTSKNVAANSKLIAHESTQVIKSLQEGLGGIRDVLLDGSQEVYCKLYRKADVPLRRAQASLAFIGSSPRFAIEAIGMALIAALAFALAQEEGGVNETIAVLGVLALAAQRLLPVLQQGYSSWITLKGNQASLGDVVELLEQPDLTQINYEYSKQVKFYSDIYLRDVSFRYGNDLQFVLKNVDLRISKGSRIGFVGPTGSGKSTLIDIIMGLLTPTEGSLEVDGTVINRLNVRTWQSNIAHVPQAIFLTDGTVEENIAFGVSKNLIDPNKVRWAAQQAQLSKTIDGWPRSYETPVGERGVRLSGGQRQRIGIARALYKNANTIIFDEATSALDGETEMTVMKTLENLSQEITVLIIAHRLTTLKNCTQIVRMDKDGIVGICKYADLPTY